MIYAINRKTKEHRIAKPATTWSGYDWELAEADADGWIEWSGGECPLPVGAEVDIKTKDARCPNGENTMTCFASTRVFSDWVIAYRPILEPQAEQVKEWPKPESSANTKEPVRPFMTGAMKESFSQQKEWRGPEDGLPQAGVECEVLQWSKWQRIVVTAIGDSMMLVKYLDVIGTPEGHILKTADFRPIRTERERWIEAATKAAPMSNDLNLRLLYDAGLARLPD